MKELEHTEGGGGTFSANVAKTKKKDKKDRMTDTTRFTLVPECRRLLQLLRQDRRPPSPPQQSDARRKATRPLPPPTKPASKSEVLCLHSHRGLSKPQGLSIGAHSSKHIWSARGAGAEQQEGRQVGAGPRAASLRGRCRF